MRAYIGVTAHWIDEDWTLRSHLLSFDELPVSHTGEAMASHLWDIIEKSIGVDNVSTPVLPSHIC